MTWAEFKAAMEAAGVKDADEIMYIDIGMGDNIDVELSPGFKPGTQYVKVT